MFGFQGNIFGSSKQIFSPAIKKLASSTTLALLSMTGALKIVSGSSPTNSTDSTEMKADLNCYLYYAQTTCQQMKEQLDNNTYYIYFGISTAILLGIYLKINPIKIPIEKLAQKHKPASLKPLSILGFLKEGNESASLINHSKEEYTDNDSISYDHVFDL